MGKVTRRSVLMGAAAAGGTILGAGRLSPAAMAASPGADRVQAAPPGRPYSIDQIRLAANGWPMLDGVEAWFRDEWIPAWPAPGTGQVVSLRAGAPALLLLYVVRRYHYEVAGLDASKGVGQVVGYEPLAPGEPASAAATNRAAGTTVAIRRDWYPRGSTGGYTGRELLTLRDILARCQGAVRWGGDSRSDADEGHFELAFGPEDPRLVTVLAGLEIEEVEHEGPGAAAALLVDTPSRRRAARDLGRLQRAEAD